MFGLGIWCFLLIIVWSQDHPSTAKRWSISIVHRHVTDQLEPSMDASWACRYAGAYFIEDLVYGHFSSALGSAPYLYQQRFLKHLSGETWCYGGLYSSCSSCSVCYQTDYFYGVGNVWLIQPSFKRPCEDSPTKRVLNFTLSLPIHVVDSTLYILLSDACFIVQWSLLFMPNQWIP